MTHMGTQNTHTHTVVPGFRYVNMILSRLSPGQIKKEFKIISED